MKKVKYLLISKVPKAVFGRRSQTKRYRFPRGTLENDYNLTLFVPIREPIFYCENVALKYTS